MEGKPMSYFINDQRKKTMLARIGEAADLIDDQRFLPFYRSIQIKLEKMGKANEWAAMIATAKEKANPKHYFAKLCRMIKDGTYRFVEKVKEVTGEAALYLHDKLVRFNFGKYQKYWVRKAQEFINVNGMSGFVDLLEYADRKNISQKYMAKALQNCKPPRRYYEQNVMGGNK
jgi:hypothetical protein